MNLDSTYISAVAAVAAVVVSIVAVIVESRRSRSAHQVSLALDFYNRFHSEQMGKKRKIASTFLARGRMLSPNDDKWGQTSDVLDFFQILGTFAKSGYVDSGILYRFFYFWLSHYWAACENHIKHVQASSPITWSDAGWLCRSLAAYDKKHNNGALSNPSDEQLTAFFQWEQSNISQ